MVFTDAQKFDEDTGADIGNFLNGYDLFHSLSKEKAAESCFIIASEDAFSCLFYENYIMPTGVTVPASVLKRVGPFDEELKNGDDRDLWYRITKEYPIGFINQIGFRYRIRLNSISTRGPELAKNKIKVIKKQMRSNLSAKLKNRCKKNIAKNLFGIGYYYQKSGNIKSARSYYKESINYHPNFPSIKGYFITMLGKSIYKTIKKIGA